MPIVFMPDVRSAQIPLRPNAFFFFFSSPGMWSPLEMKIWNCHLKQSLHFLFTNFSVHTSHLSLEDLAERKQNTRLLSAGFFISLSSHLVYPSFYLLPTSPRSLNSKGCLSFSACFHAVK